jgi:hypothetical protein
MEPIHQTYRVVGVGADKSRVTLDERLTLERAEEVKRLVLVANAFPTVSIEPEGPDDGSESPAAPWPSYSGLNSACPTPGSLTADQPPWPSESHTDRP